MEPTWQSDDGSVRLFLGDCGQVAAELEAATIQCFVTSPPYNQMTGVTGNATGSWADSHGGAGFVRMWSEMGYEDNMDELEYQEWQNRLFSHLARAAKGDASLFYNHQVRWRDGEQLHPVRWFQPLAWRFREEIVWDRGGGMMSNARMFCRFDERILWFDRGAHKWNQEATGYGTVWRIARLQQQQGKVHPVQFPEAIPSRCIEATTDPGDLVCDPFFGSGTTAVAALRLGRQFVGMEKDSRYFDLAVSRVREALGEEVAGRDGLIQRRMFADP